MGSAALWNLCGGRKGRLEVSRSDRATCLRSHCSHSPYLHRSVPLSAFDLRQSTSNIAHRSQLLSPIHLEIACITSLTLSLTFKLLSEFIAPTYLLESASPPPPPPPSFLIPLSTSCWKQFPGIISTSSLLLFPRPRD